MEQPAKFLTLKEAGARLAVSAETIRARIVAGELRAVRIGGRYRIDLRELEAFIERNST